MVNVEVLKSLSPIKLLTPKQWQEVASKAVMERLASGSYLFRQGATDNHTIYLLSGEVYLESDDVVRKSVVGGTDIACYPLVHHQPRQFSARAKTEVITLRIDNNLIDTLLTWNQSSGYVVADIQEVEETDWMTRLLKSKMFMMTDGVLLRLSKEDFNRLLKQPLLAWVSYEQATAMAREGAVWMDVRLPSEFQHARLPAAINVPLPILREQSRRLDPQRQYVCYCETGRRSSVAAFLLQQRGFDAYILKDGLMAVPAASTTLDLSR